MRKRMLLGFVLAFAPIAFAQERLLTFEIDAEACPENLETATAKPASISKRLFGVIPNYRADVLRPLYTPLTRRQKYAIARSDSFDWPNYILLAGYAVQSQVAKGGFSHNGGLSGFGKYYARSVGDQIIGSYITEAILPDILHEDPRFFRRGSGPLWQRAFYATSQIVVTRKDDGRFGFNYSEIAGNAGVVAVTSLYYPDSRSASEGAERFAMQLGNDVISNLLTEFWPDIRRRLPFHRTAERIH